jgi:hypothetical protein
MDYHVDNLGEFVKPMFFWTKDDFLTYMQYIEAISEALKADYQTIATYKRDTEQDLLTPEQRETIQHAIVDWAGQQSIWLDESESTAFPFASDINKADYQFAALRDASQIVSSALAQIGVQSQSEEKTKEIEDPDKPSGDDFMGNMRDIVKWGVIGFGVWIAYSVFKDLRR